MEFRQARLILLAALLVVASSTRLRTQESAELAAPPQPPASAPIVSSEEIERWIDELNSPDFRTREMATQQLILADAAAVQPVTEAAGHYRLEVRRRAVAIIRAIYEKSPRLAASNSAYDALNALSVTGRDSVAQEASQILRRNVFLEQRRAISAIRAMKGQVNIDYERPVIIEGDTYFPPHGWAQMVAIGEDWTGGREGLREVFKLRDTLRTVYLVRGHPLTAESILELESELPHLPPDGVQTRGDAFLGVRLSTEGSVGIGAMIGVKEGQPAADGGLVDHDSVVEIDGKPVRDADELVAVVASYRPGDIVPIVVLRGPERDRWVLRDLLTAPGSFSPLLSVGLISRMRTVKHVTLGKWSIDN